MPLVPEAVVEDRYSIVRAIRAGGMGVVYEARDRRLGDTPCALKEMLDRFDDNDDSAIIREKFEQEARVLAALDHPGIPRVRDYFVRGTICYIVMDYIDGENLEQLLYQSREATGRALAPGDVADYALQILSVLDYLHGLDPPIVHRDVKPANCILIARGQRVKLVDFGLARSVPAGSLAPQTLIGTMGYAPLEQLQGRSDNRTDLYALGATMHHLLSGQMPPPMGIPPLEDAVPDIDPGLAAIVDRATQGKADARYQTAGAMRDALLAWKTRAPAAPPAPAAATTAAAAAVPSAPVAAPRWMGPVAVLLAFVVVAAAVLVMATRPHTEVPTPPPVVASTVAVAPPSPSPEAPEPSPSQPTTPLPSGTSLSHADLGFTFTIPPGWNLVMDGINENGNYEMAVRRGRWKSPTDPFREASLVVRSVAGENPKRVVQGIAANAETNHWKILRTVDRGPDGYVLEMESLRKRGERRTFMVPTPDGRTRVYVLHLEIQKTAAATFDAEMDGVAKGLVIQR